MKKIAAITTVLTAYWASSASAAEPVLGQPVERQILWQQPATPIARMAEGFHDNLLLPITAAITVFVILLLFYTMWKFRASANPVPSKTTHNVAIEVLWTVVPVVILVLMAFPSMKLLYAGSNLPEKPAVVIKAIGHQWYWSYEYADQNIGFDVNMLKDNERKAGQPRLLAVDNPIVVPVGKVVKLLITSEDVMHAWTIPSFFLKSDAVPGRINENWFKAEKTGVYYGQCSELCGINHGYMPIEVHVVSDAQYAAWLAEAKTKFALNDNGTPGANQMAAVTMPAAAKN